MEQAHSSIIPSSLQVTPFDSDGYLNIHMASCLTRVISLQCLRLPPPHLSFPPFPNQSLPNPSPPNRSPYLLLRQVVGTVGANGRSSHRPSQRLPPEGRRAHSQRDQG